MMWAWLSKLGALFRQRELDDELDDEIRTHLEMATEENRARGMGSSEARRAARRSFGGVDQTKERSRDVRSFVWLEDLGRDLRFGVRGLARNPGFTVTAALVLSIGIGGIAAMFSVTSALFFRPFPAPEGARLVVVMQRDEHNTDPHHLSYPEYLDYREHNQVLAGLAAYRFDREMWSADGAAFGPVWVEGQSRLLRGAAGGGGPRPHVLAR